MHVYKNNYVQYNHIISLEDIILKYTDYNSLYPLPY